MERKEVLEKVKEICRDVFDDESLVVNEATTSKDIEGWDSLRHLSLVNELEETFNIAFTLDETIEGRNIGRLIDAVMRRLEEKSK